MGTLGAIIDRGAICCWGDDNGVVRPCACDNLVEDILCEVDDVRPDTMTWASLLRGACRRVVALGVMRAGDCGTLVKDLICEVKDVRHRNVTCVWQVRDRAHEAR